MSSKVNLKALRDEALIKRYYYWTEVRRLRFDDTITILSREEFFISEVRILAILRDYKKTHTDFSMPKHERMPRLTYKQLQLFKDEAGYPIAEIRP